VEERVAGVGEGQGDPATTREETGDLQEWEEGGGGVALAQAKVEGGEAVGGAEDAAPGGAVEEGGLREGMEIGVPAGIGAGVEGLEAGHGGEARSEK